ncbi:MAG: sulfotransferase domain-containing protein [Phycisphaerae bacterium]|nr:sulfotransferase domain-containing protein [Phycisphaerae bacterium]
MIIWIAGWPHNGSTLLRQILKDSFGITCYSKYPEPELESLFPGGDAFIKKCQRDPYMSFEYLRQQKEATFIKTHDLPEDDHPALFVIRDGRDAVCSLSNFWWLPLDQAITGQRCMFGSWSAYWHAWAPTERPNTAVIRFEDMVERPNEIVLPQLEQALGREPLAEYIDDFAEKQKEFPYLFKDRVGVWKKQMSESDLTLFDKCHGDLNRRLGYE